MTQSEGKTTPSESIEDLKFETFCLQAPQPSSAQLNSDDSTSESPRLQTDSNTLPPSSPDQTEQANFHAFALREEQQAAVEETAAYYRKCQSDPKLAPSFLWNAKPRFGKTLAAYCFAAQIRAQKVLIVTNRPAVADSWYCDFKRFGFQAKPSAKAHATPVSADNNNENLSPSHRWIFTSSPAVQRRLGQPADIYTRTQQLRRPELLAENFIHFISLQDIKSKDLSGFKRQNSWIFAYGEGNDSAGWDLVIIDESHEGADTGRAFQVFDSVQSKFTLHLSGTPFKALASQRFAPQQIYHWSYPDEQSQKQHYRSAPQSPYAALPQLHLFTYRLANLISPPANLNSSADTEYLYNPNELFRIAKSDGAEHFAHPQQVQQFIASLRDSHRPFPFSKASSLQQFRHTFWLLPSVQACLQLKKLLLQDRFFKQHFASEDIVIAAGKGDDDRTTNAALDEVRQRIQNPLSGHTITLSCGQLTTGVTVPAWTAVFMLTNCQSPSLYVQAAFRAQNPCQGITDTGRHFLKTNCFVFDFSPDQTLRTVAQLAEANQPNESTASREQKIRHLLQFFPVVAEDDAGKLSRLDARSVLSIPLHLASSEVLARKFMSNRLFRNINHIFACPAEIETIINKIRTPAQQSSPRIRTGLRIWLDRAKILHINEDIIVPTRAGFMTDRAYVELGTPDAAEIAQVIQLATRQARAAHYPPAAIYQIRALLTKKFPQLVVQLPRHADANPPQPPAPLDSTPSPSDRSTEDILRERLRNFARNVPTLLMAYGGPQTRLANLEQVAPDPIFTELTGLTKAEFCKLRDGIDYQTRDQAGNLVSAHFDGFLDEAVFDAAIQKFYQKRRELAHYYAAVTPIDIFTYIPAQAAHQVFTPKPLVKSAINQLIAHDPEIFKSTTHTFLDPYMKSGAFLAEIAKQLFRHTRRHYPDDHPCIKHILEHQLYGLAPTPVLQAITQNYLFGFDTSHTISRHNFRQFDTATIVKSADFAAQINSLFQKGDSMKFTAIVGNPPYMEVKPKTAAQTQGNSTWIYQHFQRRAEELTDLTCLVYPFGGWFDSPERLGGFGQQLLHDGHTVSIDAYESTADYRAWYRQDRKPQPVFGDEVNLSAGVAIVLRDLAHHHDDFWYANRIYSDQRILVKADRTGFLPPNPAFHQIYQKLTGPKLCDRLQKNVFGIESNFVATHPHQVSADPGDWREPIQLLANDRAGSAGRAKLYWIDRANVPKGAEFIDQYKVVTTAAYPKKTFVASRPTVPSVQERLRELIEILPSGSAFGRSRLALFMSPRRSECENFLKYTQTSFFTALLLQEPNRRSSFGDIIPDQDFTAHSDLDWAAPLAELDQQLCRKYHLTPAEIDFLGIKNA